MTAIGGSALTVRGFPVSSFMDARSEHTPSWAIDVGMLTNGMPRSFEIILAVSILLPPPTARMNDALASLAAFSAASTLSLSHPPVKTGMALYFSETMSSTIFPAAS